MTEAEGDTLIAPGQRSGAWALPERLGLTEEIELLRRFFAEWLESCDPELAPMLSYQLSSRSKLFRPVTVFACHRALSDEVVDRLLPAAGAAELLHNYATVTDDIVDRDRVRRGKLSLHAKFGMLAAQMTGAYLCFAAHQLVADDPRALRIFTELGKRIAAVECRQWRLRRTTGMTMVVSSAPAYWPVGALSGQARGERSGAMAALHSVGE